MSASCCCGSYEGEAAEVFGFAMIKARKRHTCCECHEYIQRGETHELAKGKWEGDWKSYRTCAACSRIRNDYCCEWTYGELRKSIWECLGFNYTEVEEGDEEDS